MTEREPEWLTVERIYELLGRSVAIDTAYKPGRVYLVKREDLEKFIRESRTMPDSEQ